MPLDGHSYLVSQGWGGKGKGLRDGAISRPIAVTKKKNLAGLGKDRDEAFPFWDHLFTAAASAIKVHVDDSDDEGSASGSSAIEEKVREDNTSSVPFKRTETGILSTRRPVHGISAHDSSGTSTPSSSSSDPSSSGRVKYSLMTIAKRDAARRGLYSRFFRGPVLGPDAGFEKQVRESSPKPQYGIGIGEETTVRAMMVRQLESAKEDAKSGKEKMKGGAQNAVVKGQDVKKMENEEKGKRRREKEERKKEKEEKRRRKEAKKAKKARGVQEAAGVKKKEGKERIEMASLKGKEKASDESESKTVSPPLDEKMVSTPKHKKMRSEKDETSQDADKGLEQKKPKKAKRRRDREDGDDTPKKKKKRKGDDPE